MTEGVLQQCAYIIKDFGSQVVENDDTEFLSLTIKNRSSKANHWFLGFFYSSLFDIEIKGRNKDLIVL